jgi:4-coumarate--CoA ligase
MCLPFFHASAVPVTHTTPLRAGDTTYVMRRFDLESFLRLLEQYEIPDITVVPPIAIATIMSPLNQRYSLKKSRNALCGAAPLDKDSQRRFLSLMGPDARFTQVWGMTETCCVAMRFPWPEEDTTGSVGRLVPNMEAKYVSIPFTGFGLTD